MKDIKTKGKFLTITLAVLAISLLLVSSIGCQNTPKESPQKPQPQQTQEVSFQRKLETPSYDGRPAIIFRMDDVAKGQNEEVVEEIIRLFGINGVPLDVGVIPHADGHDSYEMPFLQSYLDAGIIDISMHGNQHINMELDTAKSGTDYESLKSEFLLARDQFQQYFGVTPIAFSVPYDYFSEDGYNAVQDAGFKIFSTQKAVEPYPSIQPVDYSGNFDENGMVRLCTVNDVAYWDANKQEWGDIFSAEADSELFNSIDWGLNNLGVAVVGIHPQAFVDATNNIDVEKLNKLDTIIQASKKLGAITTFNAWYKYAAVVIIGPPHERKLKTPAYNGGPAVIFRMDDAQKGVNEEIVEEIIKIFQQNNAPLDVGVMPFAGGGNSYDMPFLLKYLDTGVIDITVHGYTNTFMEFHTGLSGATYEELPNQLKTCFEDAYGKATYNPTRTSYEELKSGLIKARAKFKHYFGIPAISFTVPYDNFNEDGYRAAQDAGFKVFSSGIGEDPSPMGVEMVNYFGRKDENGMYRLPYVSDVAGWDFDHCRWGGILSLQSPEDELYESVMLGLQGGARVAVIVLHPQAFVDAGNKPDADKLNKLDAIVKYIVGHKAKFGMVTTFESWYDYMSSKNK